jgi:hypothetical protein
MTNIIIFIVGGVFMMNKRNLLEDILINSMDAATGKKVLTHNMEDLI